MKKSMSCSLRFTSLKTWNILITAFLFALFFFISNTAGQNSNAAVNAVKEKVFTKKKDNALYQKCHASRHIHFTPEGADKAFTQGMYRECIIDTNQY
jgi:hypothetical protein